MTHHHCQDQLEGGDGSIFLQYFHQNISQEIYKNSPHNPPLGGFGTTLETEECFVSVKKEEYCHMLILLYELLVSSIEYPGKVISILRAAPGRWLDLEEGRNHINFNESPLLRPGMSISSYLSF